MQTLGLSSENKRSDGRLKSLFWPTVENAWDVNYLCQQGFWICVVVGLFQLVGSALSGVPLALIFGVVGLAIFFMGGMGVREASWPAAALVFAIFVANLVETMSRGGLPSIFSIIAAAILLSNVRAAFLASEWKPPAEGEDRPMRFSESLTDKIVDQWPPRLWPIMKVPFFILAGLLLLLIFAGFALEIVRRLGTI